MVVSSQVVHGEPVPGRIASWIFWQNVFTNKIEEYVPLNLPGRFRQNGYEFPGTRSQFVNACSLVYKTSGCAFCGGGGTRWDKHGYYYCLCHLLGIRSTLEKRAERLCSSWDRKTIDGISLDGQSRTEQVDMLRTLKVNTQRWIENPDTCMVLQGPTGVGKSHIIQAMTTALYPWMIYIVASDFEDLMRSGLSKDREQPGYLGELLEELIHWPIIGFDDLGIEYNTNWIMAKFEDFIDSRFRDALWRDRLTVVGTNIRKSDIKSRFMRDGVSRIGSRLQDVRKVIWSPWLDLADFRERRMARP